VTEPRLQEAMALLHQISAEFDIDVKSLRDPAKFSHFVKARKEFCIRGRRAKIQFETLGAVLRRDHSTIVFHARAIAQENKRLAFLKRAAIIEIYQTGAKIAIIAESFGVHPVSVRRIVRKAGIPMRATGRPRSS
jgi:hypothetical protein